MKSNVKHLSLYKDRTINCVKSKIGSISPVGTGQDLWITIGLYNLLFSQSSVVDSHTLNLDVTLNTTDSELKLCTTLSVCASITSGSYLAYIDEFYIPWHCCARFDSFSLDLTIATLSSPV